MQHRIILPGATTLTRLISEVREKATLRLWNKLALIPSAEQRSQLEMLLGPTDCSRLSLLESLKKGPVTISGPAFNEAIERWKTLNDFGLHAENLSTLPAVRLKNLARYAGMTSVFNIARMSPQKRMAVLVAFVLAWETLALDDALDVLDAMLAVIIRDARKIGQKKRLRSLKDLEITLLLGLTGMATLLAATTHAPTMSTLMICEMTGEYQLLPGLLIACVIASVISRTLHRDSIYRQHTAKHS